MCVRVLFVCVRVLVQCSHPLLVAHASPIHHHQNNTTTSPSNQIGLPIVYPRNDLSYAENFLHMLFAVPTEQYKVDPLRAKALETVLLLYLDHEQVRVVEGG